MKKEVFIKIIWKSFKEMQTSFKQVWEIFEMLKDIMKVLFSHAGYGKF